MGEKLRQLRRKKGLSQEAVAKELGISRQAVSKWETDIAQPDLDNLKKICEILEISADELLNCWIFLVQSCRKKKYAIMKYAR